MKSEIFSEFQKFKIHQIVSKNVFLVKCCTSLVTSLAHTHKSCIAFEILFFIYFYTYSLVRIDSKFKLNYS